MTTRYDQGMKTRRDVLGDAHVDRAEANKSDLDLGFQTLITESACIFAPPRALEQARVM